MAFYILHYLCQFGKHRSKHRLVYSIMNLRFGKFLWLFQFNFEFDGFNFVAFFTDSFLLFWWIRHAGHRLLRWKYSFSIVMRFPVCLTASIFLLLFEWVLIDLFLHFLFISPMSTADVYAFLVVFVLPLNSAVNPILYTFTTTKYRNQVLLRGWNKLTSRKWTRHEGSGHTGSGHTSGSNQGKSIYKDLLLSISFLFFFIIHSSSYNLYAFLFLIFFFFNFVLIE